jgi:amidase
MNHPLFFTSATTLAQIIREKQVSATEVLDAYLARIETVNPILNAVVELNPRARAEAKHADQLLARNASLGPLHWCLSR